MQETYQQEFSNIMQIQYELSRRSFKVKVHLIQAILDALNRVFNFIQKVFHRTYY